MKKQYTNDDVFPSGDEQPFTQCKFWDEQEFRKADMAFDGGEFSAAFHDRPLENAPCFDCDACKASSEEAPGERFAVDELPLWLVGMIETSEDRS